MFPFAGALLVWTLVTFGAVLPETALLVMGVWFTALVLLSISEIFNRGRLDYILIAALVGCGISILFLGPKLGLWALAVLWTWKAARDRPQNVLPYFRFLILLGAFEAAIGLIQYFVAPGWIFGYQNTANPVSGTLINRNHFAGLIEMFIPCSVGLGFATFRRNRDISRSYLYIFAGACMGLSLAVSLSRMGIFSLLLTSLFVSMTLLLRKSERAIAMGLSFGLIGLLAAGVLWVGVDALVERYGQIIGPSGVIEDGRAILYRDTLRMIAELPGGVGIGKYQDVFRRFQTSHLEVLFDHAHNDYLETAAEWGVGVAILFWSAIGVTFICFIKRLIVTESSDEQAILLTCTGSIFTILVHSFADFNLQIPSNAILFFTFVGIGLAMLFPKEKHKSLIEGSIQPSSYRKPFANS